MVAAGYRWCPLQEVVADKERDWDYTGHYGIGLIPCIPPEYVVMYVFKITW